MDTESNSGCLSCLFGILWFIGLGALLGVVAALALFILHL